MRVRLRPAGNRTTRTSHALASVRAEELAVAARVRNQDKHQQVVLELQIKDLLEETEQFKG